jgi:hypothetical protein
MSVQQKLKVTAIQDPAPNNGVTVAKQLKESVEVAQRLRGDPGDSYVRVSELTQGGLWTLANGVLVPTGVSKLGTSITTGDSVTGSGTTANPIQLVGDSAAPGNSQLYGTNGSGVKGWYSQPSGGSATLAGLTDVAITSPANGQVLTYVSSASKWENQAASGGTAANITPDTHPASPTIWDDEFEFGSSVDTSGSRFSGAQAWTGYTANTITSVVSQGALESVTQGTSTAAGAGYGYPVPSGNWTFVWRGRLPAFQVFNLSSWKDYYFGTTGSGNNFAIQHETRNWSTGSYSFGGSDATFSTNGTPAYFMLAWNGTNLVFSWSQSGYTTDFTTVLSVPASSFIITPDHIGFGSAGNAAVDWIRRTA